jgi:anti-anti-sigma regulatory factor
MPEFFEYNIKTKNGFTVVTWKGPMTKDSREELEKCHQDLLQIEENIIILYFKEVVSLDATVFRTLTMLQQDLRKKNRSLNLVGLCSMKKQLLLEKGIVRIGEIRASLEEAFKVK